MTGGAPLVQDAYGSCPAIAAILAVAFAVSLVPALMCLAAVPTSAGSFDTIPSWHSEAAI